MKTEPNFEKAPSEIWVWYYWAHFNGEPGPKWYRTVWGGTTEKEAREKYSQQLVYGPHVLVREVTTYAPTEEQPPTLT